jgi:branched-chain amino acid transport system substrate-binding protein
MERGLWKVLRTCWRDDQQGSVAARYIWATLKDKRDAVIHDQYENQEGDERRRRARSANESVNSGERNYAAVVTKPKQQRTDLLFWGGLHPDAGVLVRKMREQGLNTVLIAGDGIATAEHGAIARDAVEGTLMTFGPDPTKVRDASDVLKKFAAKNINPDLCPAG